MIPDPFGQVLQASTAVAADLTLAELQVEDPALVRSLHLARRRFGTALPPPFVPVPARPAELPVRPAEAADEAAWAAVVRRARRSAPAGSAPGEKRDGPVPGPARRPGFGETIVPPSPSDVLLVAGPSGEVHGVVSAGPADDPAAPGAVGEVRELCVDPTVAGKGLGGVLLNAALRRLADQGMGDVVAWVPDVDARARRFLERQRWIPDGASRSRENGGASGVEVRYRLR